MDQENMEEEYTLHDIGDDVICTNCDTELSVEVKFRCPVCGNRIKFKFMSERLQNQIISLWIGFPFSAILFFAVILGGILGGFFDEIWALLGLVMQFFTFFYGIKWIILEIRSEKRKKWKIIIGFLIFVVESYFFVFSFAIVYGTFFY